MAANVGMSLQFDIMYSGPLDMRDRVFESQDELNAYIASATAYAGHIVRVKDTVDGETNINLYLINEDKSLSPIASASSADLEAIMNSLTWVEIPDPVPAT